MNRLSLMSIVENEGFSIFANVRFCVKSGNNQSWPVHEQKVQLNEGKNAL